MTEKRNALLIANYEYEDEGLRQLITPVQDAEALTRVLEDPAIGHFVVRPQFAYQWNKFAGKFVMRHHHSLLKSSFGPLAISSR